MELLQTLNGEWGEGCRGRTGAGRGRRGEGEGEWGRERRERERERERERGNENQQKASKSAFRSRPEALATLKRDLEVTSDWLTSQKEW